MLNSVIVMMIGMIELMSKLDKRNIVIALAVSSSCVKWLQSHVKHFHESEKRLALGERVLDSNEQRKIFEDTEDVKELVINVAVSSPLVVDDVFNEINSALSKMENKDD